MKPEIVRLLILLPAVIVLCLMVFDARMKTVFYNVETEQSGGRVRIALVTDLHSCRYGKGQCRLLDAIDAQKPDLVLLGGDIFDDHMKQDRAREFVSSIGAVYPCFYVTGNHEYWSHDIDNILDFIRSCGVTVLAGDCRTVEINGRTLNICGISDPDSKVYNGLAPSFARQLDSAAQAAQNGSYTVLLSHRPEQVEQYQKRDFDLILCGHAHGGQWRIPGLLNGFLAPDQGFFPKYAGGRYELDGCTMIVSRGLARESTLVPRVFNRPELVIVDIQ